MLEIKIFSNDFEIFVIHYTGTNRYADTLTSFIYYRSTYSKQIERDWLCCFCTTRRAKSQTKNCFSILTFVFQGLVAQPKFPLFICVYCYERCLFILCPFHKRTRVSLLFIFTYTTNEPVAFLFIISLFIIIYLL